jgi:hypothetical protein
MRQLGFLLPAAFRFFVVLTTSSFTPEVSTLVKTHSPSSQTPISIDMLGDGTFTASGGLNLEGAYTMDVQLNGQSRIGSIQCTVVLYPSNSSSTINIIMHCQFATSTGQWKIVSGTGNYSNLKGNGSLVMSGDDEFLDGKIM